MRCNSYQQASRAVTRCASGSTHRASSTDAATPAATASGELLPLRRDRNRAYYVAVMQGEGRSGHLVGTRPPVPRSTPLAAPMRAAPAKPSGAGHALLWHVRYTAYQCCQRCVTGRSRHVTLAPPCVDDETLGLRPPGLCRRCSIILVRTYPTQFAHFPAHNRGMRTSNLRLILSHHKILHGIRLYPMASRTQADTHKREIAPALSRPAGRRPQEPGRHRR